MPWPAYLPRPAARAALAAALAACAAPRAPAPPAAASAAPAPSASAPPPCASLPAHDPRCVVGLGATILGVCAWSLHAVTCWGNAFEDTGQPLVEFRLDPWTLAEQVDASRAPEPAMAEARRALRLGLLPPRELASAERTLPRSEIRQTRCSLSTAGEVRCAPSFLDPDDTSAAWRFLDLDASAALASSGRFACALSLQGVIRCWGSALGFPAGYAFPLARAKVRDFVASDGGFCVRLDAGEVACVRRKGYAQPPVKVALGEPVEQLSEVGEPGFCGLRKGQVICWSFEQAPQAVEGLLDATALVPGEPCARRPGRALACWQRGAPGADGSPGPLKAYGPRGGKAPAAGENKPPRGDRCAVEADGAARCAPLGKGSPARVLADAPVSAIVSSGDYTCALLRDGGLRCLKNGDPGVSVDLLASGSKVPLPVPGEPPARP